MGWITLPAAKMTGGWGDSPWKVLPYAGIHLVGSVPSLRFSKGSQKVAQPVGLAQLMRAPRCLHAWDVPTDTQMPPCARLQNIIHGPSDPRETAIHLHFEFMSV